MDWKFIWVVRDPRALAASQEHAKGDEAEDTCQQMAANLNLLLNPTANWIRNKILIIRYEGMIKLYRVCNDNEKPKGLGHVVPITDRNIN